MRCKMTYVCGNQIYVTMKKALILPFLFLSINFAFAQEITKAKQVSNMDELTKAAHYTQVADNYIRGLNEKDLEGILSLYADNGSVEDPVGSQVISGIDNLRKFYSGAVNMDLNLTRTGAVRIAGMEAAFPFQLRMKAEGKLMVTDIIDVFRFDKEGKIVSMRAFWGPSNRREARE